MTSHKLCQTFLVLAVSVSAIATATGGSLDDSSYRPRGRRSGDDKRQESAETTTSEDVGGFQGGYRFGDEFFLPEASRSIPAEYKKKADGCERVTRDTMVCMVCKDPKTNAKYEQCSYVGNPPPKTATSSRPEPTDHKRASYESSGESAESSTLPRGSRDNYESSTPPRGSHENHESSSTPPRGESTNYESSSSPGEFSTYESSTPSRGDYSTYEPAKDDYAAAPYSYSTSSAEESASSEDPVESSDCRQIERGSQSCRICKDPKTGKDFERCSSSFRPDDKSYAYGKTERYGYPESVEDDKDDSPAELRTFENDEAAKGGSEDPAETSECRQVKKDDQTCTICKDPKTGGDSERCSSSYRPADEAYAYGTSEKFGGPHGKDDYKSYGEAYESDKAADATYEIPAEYQSAYPKSDDDTYKNYHTEQPEDYSRSVYDAGYDASGSPSYGDSGSSGGAEYAAPSVPSAAAAKPSGKGGADGCHEVRKDSMTCTVCTDPKTGGNFEKCSYAYQPDDKVYKFTKSKTFGYPEAEKNRGASGDSADQSESKRVEAVKEAKPCRKIQRDSMVCTVCRDPKTGVSSEQCAYGSIPSEKLFANAASKAFGGSGKDEGSGKKSDQEGQQESRQSARWSGEETGQIVAESKQIADKVKTNPCRKIEKDTMTCTICKDPKTGASSEQCSYSSRPKENLYAYSKSKSSGSPKKSGDEEEEQKKTKEIAETAEATSPCKKIEKDSMTCTICKDPKTGENSEQCAYSYKPKERHFTYTKSKSFGNPRKEGEGSQEEKPEETHQISRWSNDDYYAKVNRPRGFSKPEWTYGE